MRSADAPAAESGGRKIEWTEPRLRILQGIGEEFARTRPFAGLTIGICLHIEPKTAVLCKTLMRGGAQIALTGSPGTTQDDVAAALSDLGVHVYGRQSDGRPDHLENISQVLRHVPNLLLDNGADLAATLVQECPSQTVTGGTEETTSGASRLRGELLDRVSFPVIVVNDSPLKLIMENEHGVGQTVIEAFMRTTNLLVPSKRFVVLGYGSCGRGVARYLRRFGARVAVVEPDPIRGLEAALDGMLVAPLDKLLNWGEVFITVTGQPNVLSVEHMQSMTDGTVLANAGHFSWEIDLDGLRRASLESKPLAEHIEQHTLSSGKRIAVLANGGMINLAAGKGNPTETMDMGLSLQALSLLWVAQGRGDLRPGAQAVPHEINRDVASRMLAHIFPAGLGPA